MMDNEAIPRDKAELMARIEQEWQALWHTTARLNPTQMATPDSGGWSPNDNLAHLTVWEQFVLRCILQNEPPHEVLRIDESAWEQLDQDGLNRILFERDRLRSAEDVIRELQHSHAEVLAALEKMTFAELMRPNPEDPEGRPMIIWVIGNTYEHYRTHRQTIQAILEE